MVDKILDEVAHLLRHSASNDICALIIISGVLSLGEAEKEAPVNTHWELESSVAPGGVYTEGETEIKLVH